MEMREEVEVTFGLWRGEVKEKDKACEGGWWMDKEDKASKRHSKRSAMTMSTFPQLHSFISLKIEYERENSSVRHTLLTLTVASFEMTPVPLHGASSKTRSNPPMTFGNSLPS